MTGLRADGDVVELTLRDGATAVADLVVAADGISSGTRSALLPGVAPSYSGYVAWRGTLPESELDDRTFAALADAITYQVLPHSHVLVYPIPGPDGAREPGRRLMNFVWYRNVHAGDRWSELLTDRDGRIRQVSLPPGAARAEFVDRLRADARDRLAAVLAEVVTRSPSRSFRSCSTSRCRAWCTVGSA